MAKLMDLAKVIRSKNAGPFEITFDIMFSDETVYRRVKSSGILTEDLLCRLYSVQLLDIVTCLFFDPALAFKFTLKRLGKSAQGSIGERDTFGAQQHAPLMEIEIP